MIGIIVFFLIFFGFGAYIYLMIFHPEWVGISGKSTQETLLEHQEGSEVDDSDLFSSRKDSPKE